MTEGHQAMQAANHLSTPVHNQPIAVNICTPHHVYKGSYGVQERQQGMGAMITLHAEVVVVVTVVVREMALSSVPLSEDSTETPGEATLSQWIPNGLEGL
ncbi:hypothetical protein BaRGS_00001234 [Batillaria attramentaria]|uniref:Uncharacterized protein n=1 Tax=Batillaria attramentaria TaxID=370345 RepID=A0ABD0M697_9CAEN